MKNIIENELIGLGIFLVISIPFFGVNGILFGFIIWYLFYFPYLIWFINHNYVQQFLFTIICGFIISPMIWWVIIAFRLRSMIWFYIIIPLILFFIGLYFYRSSSKKNQGRIF